jgi:hypothetical protein
MSDDDLEQRIRTALRRDAENARVSPHAWTRVSARLEGEPDARPRSHRGRSIGLAVAGAAALATVGAVALPQLLSGPSGEPAERGSVFTAQTPKGPNHENALGHLPRAVGTVRIGPEVLVTILHTREKGGTIVKLAATHQGPKAILEPPFDQVEVAMVAKPTDKVGVCQFRVVNGRTKTVTVSVAPAGAACTKPVTYTIGSTQLTRTG